MIRNSLLDIAVILSITMSAQASLLNGGFDNAVLGNGQSLPAVGQYKPLDMDPLSPAYGDRIEAVTNWVNAYQLNSNTHSDVGLSRNVALGGDTDQFAQANWWNGRLSQSDGVVAAGAYNATIEFALSLDNPDQKRAGRFQLWAGSPDPANPDEFLPGSIMLAEVTAANANWDNFVPDVVVADLTWMTLNINHVVNAGDPAIGMPITVSFHTEAGSQGPTYWDNATLIPEPASLLLIGLAIPLVIRRRR